MLSVFWFMCSTARAAHLHLLAARLTASFVPPHHAGCVLVHVLLHLHHLRVAAAAGVELGLEAELQVAAVLQAQKHTTQRSQANHRLYQTRTASQNSKGQFAL
jgi:hypothetical protein